MPSVQARATAHATTTYNVTAGDVTSLENAITSANADNDDSVVNVPAGTYTLNGSALPNVTADNSTGTVHTFTMTGAGARSTIIDSAAPSGSGSTILTIGSSAVATISGVTLENASVDGFGGALAVVGPFDLGTLTLTDSTVTNNETAFSGEDGGGIFNAGALTLERDTFSNNRSATNGSAIASEPFAVGAPVRGLIGGNVTIVNTTFNGNEAGEDGQGTGEGTIYLDGNALDLVNDTIAGNGDLNSAGNGGLFVDVGQANVVNTIIAGNTAGTGASTTQTNCGIGNGVISSQGHNIESGTDCGFLSAGDQQNTNPVLGPLQNNGGQMDTMALLAGSPAIDKADSANCPATDEIGTTRPQGPGCDIGAYEVPLPPPPAPPAPPAPTPPAPPAQPAAPKVSVAGVRRACVSHSFHLRFRITTAASVKSVKVRLDGRTIKSTTRRSFTLTINSRRLKAGRHRLTITATDSNGKVTTSRRTFSVCKAAKPRHHAVPRFTG